MNVISSRAAYSLFPQATFVQHKSLNIDTSGEGRELARLKYASRGWNMISHVSPDDALNRRSDFRIGFRWIGDKRTWTIPLPFESGKEVRVKGDLLTLNSFGLEYERGPHDEYWSDGIITGPKLVYELCESEQWRDIYAFSDRRECQSDWSKVQRQELRFVSSFFQIIHKLHRLFGPWLQRCPCHCRS